MRLRGVLRLLKETATEWQEDKVPVLAAALSYYTVFSLAPLLLIAIAIAGAVFGEEAARGEVVKQIQGLVGQEGAEAIQSMIQNAQKPESGGAIATVIGIVTLLFGASGVFGQLQDALNTIWEVKPKPDGGWKSFLQSRFLSFGMVLVVGFLLLVSLMLSRINRRRHVFWQPDSGFCGLKSSPQLRDFICCGDGAIRLDLQSFTRC